MKAAAGEKGWEPFRKEGGKEKLEERRRRL